LTDTPRFIEATPSRPPAISLTIDGEPLLVPPGRSILAAILCHRPVLRTQAVSGEARAGFCLMGACQECWIWRSDGVRLRACTTPVEDGMVLTTGTPPGFPRHG
jgi:predicted molibdopterin-dependent oxidoreductase YjgC